MGMTFALSDWEMDEMAYYRVSEKTVQRILRRLAVEPSRPRLSHATTEND